MNKKILMASVVMICILMTGCFGGESKNDSADGTAKDNVFEEQFTIKYPEAMQEKFGEEVVLDKTPERIIVMTSGPVQTLYEMGVEMLAIPDSIISSWSKDIKAQRLPFSYSEIDIEGILALNPDFVILSSYNKEKYGAILEQNNIPTYYVSAGPFVLVDDIKEEVEIFGNAFNKQEEKGIIMKKFQDVENKMKEYKEKNKSESVSVLFGYPPSMTMTSKSYLGDILSKLGFTNVADNNELMLKQGSSTTLNMEKFVEVDPKLIVAISPSIKNAEDTKKSFQSEFNKNRAIWDKISAVKNGDVVYLGSSLSKSSGIKVIDDINTLIEILEKR